MPEPIERPWNQERDAQRAEQAREYEVEKKRGHKKCWIWAAVIVAAGVILGIYAAANPDPCSRADNARRLAELHLEDGLIGPAGEELDNAVYWSARCAAER